MLALRRWGQLSAGHDGDEGHRRDLQPAVVAGSLLDQSCLIPSALMLLAVVAVSFVKPLAFWSLLRGAGAGGSAFDCGEVGGASTQPPR